MFISSDLWRGRLKAAGIHLVISLGIAAMAALLVFFIWYPYPYREVSGGRELFLLVVTVDVIMGPLMTLAVFSQVKSRKLLRFDLTVIGLLQLVALVYGLWTVAVARPVHLVFEIDRFRIVHAVDVPPSLLKLAAPSLQSLPLMGPTLLSVRKFKDGKEKFDATLAALQGLPLGARPDLWQDYEKAKPDILTTAKSLAELKTRFPERANEMDAALKTVPANIAIGSLPLVSRSTFWTVLINTQTAEVLAFVPLDPY